MKYASAAAIYEAAKHSKRFVSPDQADHLLSDKRDSQYVAATVAAWHRFENGLSRHQ